MIKMVYGRNLARYQEILMIEFDGNMDDRYHFLLENTHPFQPYSGCMVKLDDAIRLRDRLNLYIDDQMKKKTDDGGRKEMDQGSDQASRQVAS